MNAKRILIVDHEPKVRMELWCALSVKGYLVTVMDNSADAILYACLEPPDLVILDIAMPGINGIQFARILGRIPETRDVGLLFLTGLISRDDQDDRDLFIGRSLTVAMPFDTEELLIEIEMLIRDQRALGDNEGLFDFNEMETHLYKAGFEAGNADLTGSQAEQ